MIEAVVGNVIVQVSVEPAPTSGVHLKETPTPLPEGIPRDYAELYKMYAPFVVTALRRYNKVGRNFDEMYAYIWKRLVEKKVITLFMDSVSEKLPKQMTGEQVLKYLGIKKGQWKTKMWKYHVGVPIYSKASLPHVKAVTAHKKTAKAFEAEGNLEEAAKYMKLVEFHKEQRVIIARHQGPWAPTPINAGEFEQGGKSNTAGYAALTAMFDTEDIIILRSMETMRDDGSLILPFKKMRPVDEESISVKATKAHFMAYLSKSIYSDFLNWCRTYRRKWSQDKPMYLRPDNEEDADWERNLVDPAGAKQETQTIISQACTLISKTFRKGMAEEGPGLKCKPVEQTEMEMFELLEQGVPLQEVVKKLQIPDRVRRNILRSIADIRPGQAA